MTGTRANGSTALETLRQQVQAGSISARELMDRVTLLMAAELQKPAEEMDTALISAATHLLEQLAEAAAVEVPVQPIRHAPALPLRWAAAAAAALLLALGGLGWYRYSLQSAQDTPAEAIQPLPQMFIVTTAHMDTTNVPTDQLVDADLVGSASQQITVAWK